MIMVRVVEPGRHEFLAEPQPVPLVGKTTSKRKPDGSVNVRWESNIVGERMPDETIVLRSAMYRGKCSDATTGTAAVGSWATYDGPALGEGKGKLERIVGRAWERSDEGRAHSTFQCRGVGMHPDMDVFGVEEQVREWWPDEAERALRDFQSVCAAMERTAEQKDSAGEDDAVEQVDGEQDEEAAEA